MRTTLLRPAGRRLPHRFAAGFLLLPAFPGGHQPDAAPAAPPLYPLPLYTLSFGGGHPELELADLPDLSGDGVRDFLVGIQDSGLVSLRSGANGVQLNSWTGLVISFGTAVAAAGDVDGDGVGDFLIGSPREGSFGTVHVYSGATQALLAAFGPQGTVNSTQTIHFGESVASAGDLNGDGRSEIAVGAPRDNGRTGKLEVIDLQGGAAPVLLDEWFGTGTYSTLGDTVASAGDQNGDGVADLLVGATERLAPFAIQGPGEAFLLDGASLAAAGPPAVLRTFTGPNAGSCLGFALADAGDIDGNGRSEYLIGAPDFGPYQNGAGSAELRTGATHNGLGWTYPGRRADWHRGRSVAPCRGDRNGDGRADVLIGCADDSSGAVPQTIVVVLDGRDGTQIERVKTPTSSGQFGYSLCGLGDIDGDGLANYAIADASAGTVDVF